jgi:hypothetical protein
LVSLFMDVSSELIHSLLPLFMTTVLGVTMTSVGCRGDRRGNGAGEQGFLGTLSDYLGKRKLLTLIGYGGAALTKPLFPWPTAWDWSWLPDSLTGSARASGGRPATR